MTSTTWSGTEAAGPGSYQLGDCNPSCAAATGYPVAAMVTFSQPVKVCAASRTRQVWSCASFTFPRALPKALPGSNTPQNPWIFSFLIDAARQSCT